MDKQVDEIIRDENESEDDLPQGLLDHKSNS
jgi:hypothetical protein